MEWIPGLFIMFSIVVIYGHARLKDLRRDTDARFADQSKRIDDLRDSIRAEIKRLEDRIEQRLVRP